LAHWYYRQGTLESLEHAIAWNPNEPRYYAALARGRQAALAEADPDEVVHLCERAVALAPRRAEYWAQLGSAYEWAGHPIDARRAYTRAQRQAPNSPQLNWEAGNFYLRAGDFAAAFSALRRVLLYAPELRNAVFALAWRAAEGDQIRSQLLPPQADVLLDYLGFLAATNRVEEAEQIWTVLLKLQPPFPPQRAFPYLDLLMKTRRTDKLRAAWTHLYPFPTPPGEYVTNGGFEQDVWNAGLDWHVYQPEGARAAIEPGLCRSGHHAMVIRFDGTQNIHFSHVFQFVVVEPDRRYRLTAWVQAGGLTTDSGPQIELFDLDAPQRLRWTTPAVVGTADWTELSLEFHAGPQTRILMLRVTRLPSRRLDNRIVGTFRLDDVSLRQME
jgi:tetratricopeptide (TPR) repeat protein